MTWNKYRNYVDKYFRFMRTGDFVIGSVPHLLDEDGQVVKTVFVKMRWEEGIKKRLKFILAEKLPSIWGDIPQNLKGVTDETMESSERR